MIWAIWRKFEAVFGPGLVCDNAKDHEQHRACLIVRDAPALESLEVAASSQLVINSPASRLAEICLPSESFPLEASWIAEPVAFRATKRPNPACKTFGEVSPHLLSKGTEAITARLSHSLRSVRINPQPWRSTSCLDRVHKNHKRCCCDGMIATGLRWATIHLPQV